MLLIKNDEKYAVRMALLVYASSSINNGIFSSEKLIKIKKINKNKKKNISFLLSAKFINM